MKKDLLLQVKIDQELLNKLKVLADSNYLSLSAQVRMLIKKATD